MILICYFVKNLSHGPKKLHVYDKMTKVSMARIRRGNNQLLIILRRCFFCGFLLLGLNICFLLIFDVLNISKIASWPSSVPMQTLRL